MAVVFGGLSDPEAFAVRAQKRVQGLSEARLLDWLEAALPGMQRHFDMYRRTGEIAHFGELTLAHMNAGVVIDELLERYNKREGT